LRAFSFFSFTNSHLARFSPLFLQISKKYFLIVPSPFRFSLFLQMFTFLRTFLFPSKGVLSSMANSISTVHSHHKFFFFFFSPPPPHVPRELPRGGHDINCPPPRNRVIAPSVSATPFSFLRRCSGLAVCTLFSKVSPSLLITLSPMAVCLASPPSAGDFPALWIFFGVFSFGNYPPRKVSFPQHGRFFPKFFFGPLGSPSDFNDKSPLNYIRLFFSEYPYAPFEVFPLFRKPFFLWPLLKFRLTTTQKGKLRSLSGLSPEGPPKPPPLFPPLLFFFPPARLAPSWRWAFPPRHFRFLLVCAAICASFFWAVFFPFSLQSPTFFRIPSPSSFYALY